MTAVSPDMTLPRAPWHESAQGPGRPQINGLGGAALEASPDIVDAAAEEHRVVFDGVLLESALNDAGGVLAGGTALAVVADVEARLRMASAQVECELVDPPALPPALDGHLRAFSPTATLSPMAIGGTAMDLDGGASPNRDMATDRQAGACVELDHQVVGQVAVLTDGEGGAVLGAKPVGDGGSGPCTPTRVMVTECQCSVSRTLRTSWGSAMKACADGRMGARSQRPLTPGLSLGG
jgi:hypothetical protein